MALAETTGSTRTRGEVPQTWRRTLAQVVAIICAIWPFSVPSVQAQNSCELIDSRQFVSVAGGAVVYVGGPVFSCGNGTRISADSGVIVKSTGRADFMGNVRFTEATRSMTSGFAQYVSRERRLMAQVNVRLTDKNTGTTLRGTSMDYYQESPGREARIEMFSGRPHATIIRRSTDSARIRVDSTNVDADQITIIGENAFRGRGNVDVRRGTLTSKSNYAEFDQSGNTMKLYGQAVVRTDTLTLSADTIDATLEGGETFKEVKARRNVKLDSKDVDIDAPVLNIEFTEGKVERMIALGGAKAGGAAQANAVSQDFTLIADSIDATSPGQKLRMVAAVGRASGVRHPDSLDLKLPEPIQRDWVKGDTVRAFFTDAPEPTGTPRDTAVASQIERLFAAGRPASSTYRQKEIVKDSTELTVNYLTARTIEVIMKAGQVDRVDAEGDIRGVYLQQPKRSANAQVRQ